MKITHCDFGSDAASAALLRSNTSFSLAVSFAAAAAAAALTVEEALAADGLSLSTDAGTW